MIENKNGAKLFTNKRSDLEPVNGIVCVEIGNIEPVCSVSEALENSRIVGDTNHLAISKLNLEKVSEPKPIYALKFLRKFNSLDYINYLEEKKLEICSFGPNYLLGIIKKIPEEDMPESLYGDDLVAAHPYNPTKDTFIGPNGNRFNLCLRNIREQPKLSLVPLNTFLQRNICLLATTVA